MSLPIVVGITGASGAAYAVRLIEELKKQEVPVDLVVTDMGQRLLKEESGVSLSDLDQEGVQVHPIRDLGAQLSTGSYRTRGMVVIPATTGTCGKIAAGTSENLVVRAADVTLKEGRKLVIVVRETPLNLIHLRALTTLAEAGATVMPASPGFYHNPKDLDGIIDFMVDRVLAQFDLNSSNPVKYSPDNGQA
ncbi:MAG: UbiX family flavin prenyltransferase [Candidatus Lindowbacteria bacterium]|nr:UbiX family flavin prenyltransferase [Candidatus Lindowbacteria bacterium]